MKFKAKSPILQEMFESYGSGYNPDNKYNSKKKSSKKEFYTDYSENYTNLDDDMDSLDACIEILKNTQESSNNFKRSKSYSTKYIHNSKENTLEQQILKRNQRIKNEIAEKAAIRKANLDRELDEMKARIAVDGERIKQAMAEKRRQMDTERQRLEIESQRKFQMESEKRLNLSNTIDALNKDILAISGMLKT